MKRHASPLVLVLLVGFSGVAAAAAPPVPRAPAAPTRRIAVSRAVKHLTSAELRGFPTSPDPQPPTAPSPLATYRTGVSLSPYAPRHAVTGSTATFYALIVDDGFAHRTRDANPAASAITVAGLINTAANQTVPVCRALFQNLPPGSRTYLVTVATTLPPSRAQLHTGDTVIPTEAISWDGSTMRALVGLSPTAESLNAASIFFCVRGRLAGFSVGPIRLQLVD